jgi:hypothetical protein
VCTMPTVVTTNNVHETHCVAMKTAPPCKIRALRGWGLLFHTTRTCIINVTLEYATWAYFNV